MGESMRRLPRLLVGLMLGMALVVGLVPWLGARVALAADPTYTITVNDDVFKTDAALDTQYAYTMPKPDGFSQFSDPAASCTGNVTLGTITLDHSNWSIPFSVNAAGTGTVTVNWKDTSEAGHTETLNVSCTQNIPIDGVTVDSTATIGVDKTITLKPTVTPDNATYKTVTWMPDDSGVATVDENGTVTGHKVGTGLITVKATNATEDTADDKEATCVVTVIQLVESVELNKTTATIEVGATDQLTATVNPDNATNKAVTWSSSDTSVATVDENGKVKGLKAGEATIIATATNGTEDTADDKVATCVVTVAQPTYTATTGAGATWTKGSTDGLQITFTRNDGVEKTDTAFSHFKSAFVDGNEIKKDEDYTIAEGSLVINLSSAYLNTLATGEHTLTATFDDGDAPASFSIAEAQTTSQAGSQAASQTETKTETSRSLPDPPKMSNSRGGTLTSVSETITYTITQKVPGWASSLRTWVDLESVLEFVDGATVTCNGKQVTSAEADIDGQKLTVTIPDVTEYRGKTIQITYSAKLRSGANLDPYRSSNIASVPYQAHSIFDNDESTKVSSAREVVKISVGNGGSNSSTTKTSAPSTASTTSTLAKTGDTTSFTAVAAMAVTGASALVVGRRRKR